MPRQQDKHPCPRCRKGFPTSSAAVNHMNQPHSKCRFLYENVLHFQCPSGQGSIPATHPTQHPAPASFEIDPSNGEQSAFPDEGHMDMNMNDEQPVCQNSVPENPQVKATGFFSEQYPRAGHVYGKGKTFMEKFDMDEHADKRSSNLYYPFSSQAEWQLAMFVLKSGLSMSDIDEFLKLEMIVKLKLSFCTAKDLRGRAEILPTGPRWSCQPITPSHPTKNAIHLYFRNPLECLEFLLSSPLLKDHILFGPFRLFQTAEKLMRIYTEWLSGDAAWLMQEKLPPGATLLGAILSSDKTNISNMTRGRVAHPLLISLANLSMEFRNKASNHAFLLLALLPVPKFLHKVQKIRGVLEARLYHECLDFILQPLKIASQIGVMMADPVGALRQCFTPLASFIVDSPEAALIAGVAGKTSPVTLATHKQFGDPFRHPSRLAHITLGNLAAIGSNVNPGNLEDYVKEAMKYRLSGVHRPCWRDWQLSDPSIFLTSEPLHHWHKQVWDHDAKWCVFAVGAAEIDFRFSILHPRTGYRHFHEGISSLKQVTGREHRDIQRYIVAVIADAVSPHFLVAIRSLLDFRYLAQATVITERMCIQIEEALRNFHDHKYAITQAGARRGKKGPINHWEIPKLEFLQSVVHNIRYNGVAIQWSADTTEFAHIPLVKDPARSSNNQNYESQICRSLDRKDKLANFDLATSIHAAGISFVSDNPPRQAEVANNPDSGPQEQDADSQQDEFKISTTAELLAFIKPASETSGGGVTNYFYQAEILERSPSSSTLSRILPHHTCRSSTSTAFHLARNPSIRRTPINDIATLFNLPDLRPAIADYLTRLKVSSGGHLSSIGGRRIAKPGCLLPVTCLEVWSKVRLQSTTYHHPHNILPPQTINATSSSSEWPHGHFDSVIVNIDAAEKWPISGLKGHAVCDLRLIFRLISDRSAFELPNITDRFLCYVQRYDLVPQANPENSTQRGVYPDPSSGLYLLRRGRRTNDELIGDIVPLDQIRALADIAPRLGPQAERRFTKGNSLHYATEFWLNKYFDKEMFYALQC